MTDWRSHAAWRSHFFVLLMLGGVAIFNFCNPSTVRMVVLLMAQLICILVLGGARFFVLLMLGGVAIFNVCNPRG